MIIGRILGWLCLMLGIMLLGNELLASLKAGEWAPQLLGQLWFDLDAKSLNLVQAVVQRYLFAQLWDPIIVELLLWPAWIIFVVPGVLFLILFRDRRNRFAPRKYLN
ncbi:hypothetical protein [Sneathiella glossodoripedis]|uniref:hypothetical protein n=1 Tax=Sneathiella glossodoripedis TaxID=418853 RepID=UPI0019026EDC|nr:hypothetical protein [Sneathiella glossodoripedis]